MSALLAVFGWMILLLITGWSWVLVAVMLRWMGSGASARGETLLALGVSIGLSWLCWYSAPFQVAMKVAQ